jgi:hypothetical protein
VPSGRGRVPSGRGDDPRLLASSPPRLFASSPPRLFASSPPRLLASNDLLISAQLYQCVASPTKNKADDKVQVCRFD